MIGLIANDSINNFDDIGNDNYDYTTQEMVIELQKVVRIKVNENP